MKLLLDTNIYLELFLKRENYLLIKNLFFLFYRNNLETYITTQSLRDIEFILRRQLHDYKIAKLLQHKAYEITSKVISISNDTAIDALFSNFADYEDALQSFAAEESNIDAIITFNKKDYLNKSIPTFSPQEIFNYISKQNQ